MITFIKTFTSHLCIFLVGLLLVVFSLHLWFGPDIWHHLERGQAIVTSWEANPPLKFLVIQPATAAPAWLFQLFVYSLFILGSVVLTSLVFSGIWILIAYNWIRATGSKFNIFTAFLFLVFVVCIQLRMEHRPEVFSYLMMLLSIRLISTEGHRQKAALIALLVLQLIWTNTHGYFIFGIGIALAKLASVIVEHQQNKRAEIQKFGLLTLGLFLVSFIHPNGYLVWDMVLQYSNLLSTISHEIEEFLPTYKFAINWPLTLYWPYVIVSVLSAIYCLATRKHIFAACLVLGSAFVSIQSYRSLGIFLILSAPMAGVISNWALSFVSKNKWSQKIQGAVAAIIVVSSLVLTYIVVSGEFYIWRKSGTFFGIGLDHAETPIETAKFLKDHNFKGNLFCDPNDCGYLGFHVPGTIVPGDSYFSDPATTLKLFNQTLSSAGFMDLDSQFRFQAAVVSIFNTETIVHLLNSDFWDVAFSDSHRIVFFRKYSKEMSFEATTLAQSVHHNHEDLRRSPYALAIARWVEIAILRKDLNLANALVDQVTNATYIPSGFIKNLYIAALASGSRELATKASSLEPKIYVHAEDDLTEIQRLKKQLNPN